MTDRVPLCIFSNQIYFWCIGSVFGIIFMLTSSIHTDDNLSQNFKFGVITPKYLLPLIFSAVIVLFGILQPYLLISLLKNGFLTATLSICFLVLSLLFFVLSFLSTDWIPCWDLPGFRLIALLGSRCWCKTAFFTPIKPLSLAFLIGFYNKLPEAKCLKIQYFSPGCMDWTEIQ